MKILTIHYKKNKDSDITYYQEHLLTNKQAYMFGGKQFEENSRLEFESYLCAFLDNKYVKVEEEPTMKLITLYTKHELRNIDNGKTDY